MGAAGPTVLLVDDNKAGRYVLSRMLRAEGYEVWEAGDAAEALLLVTRHPDLVILDVKLPDLDGFEVCRRIKASPETAAIPVIHMSARYWQEEDRQRGLAAGAEAYITGFDVHAVLSAARDVLARPAHRLGGPRTVPSEPPARP